MAQHPEIKLQLHLDSLFARPVVGSTCRVENAEGRLVACHGTGEVRSVVLSFGGPHMQKKWKEVLKDLGLPRNSQTLVCQNFAMPRNSQTLTSVFKDWLRTEMLHA